MIVTFVQHRPGSRIPRMMKALRAAGVRCRLLTREPMWHGEEDVEPGQLWRWNEVRDVTAYVDRDRETDVWHVSEDFHTEWLGTAVMTQRNVTGDRRQRVVWDLRDMGSLHARQIWTGHGAQPSPIMRLASAWEQWNMTRVDGLVHVSVACQKTAEGMYPDTKQRPVAVVRNVVGRDQLCPLPDPDTRAGLVYSGGLAYPGNGGATRDYGPILLDFLHAVPDVPLERDIPGPFGLRPVSVQSASFRPGETEQAYEDMGCEVHPRADQAHLVSSLTKFRWGLVGFPVLYPLGAVAWPNKLGEYVAAGVVPVCINAREAHAVCHRAGIGIGGSVEEVLSQMTRETWERCYRNLVALRESWVMEEDAKGLLQVYREALRKPARFTEPVCPADVMWDPYLEAKEREAAVA